MNPYALAWTLIAATGTVLSIYLLAEAILDLQALRNMLNGRRLRVKGRIASEAIRATIHGAFMAIGIASLHAPVRPGSELLIAVFLGGNLGLITNSLISVYVNRRAELSLPAPLTAEQLVAQAADTARVLLATAEKSAADLLRLASEAASALDQVTLERTERLTDATERTAENTERIAENTEPKP